MTLKKRIETLEHRLAINDDIRGIFFHRVIPGDVGPNIMEPDGYQHQNFAPIFRQAGETIEQLQKRSLNKIADLISSPHSNLPQDIVFFRPIYSTKQP